MEWLNYHHLLYFWAVAKDGSIAKACVRLRLAQPTISGQLKALEDSLGEALFRKAGRGLELTDTGRVVFEYAEEIFGLGRELQDVLKGYRHGKALRLVAGVSDLMPKLIAYRILSPSLRMREPVQMTCLEDSPERLLAELAEHRLDMVLADMPMTAMARGKAFHHLLGSSEVSWYGGRALVKRYRRGFPGSLNGAPFLLPLQGSGLRRSLDRWFDEKEIRPVIVGEFKDSALMKSFGQAGTGFFAAPAAIAAEIARNYQAWTLGPVEAVREHYYAISLERKVRHPAVAAVCDAARSSFFSTGS